MKATTMQIIEVCFVRLATANNAATIDQIVAETYHRIELSHSSKAACATENTKVLRLATERREALGISCPASHEDKDEPLPERLRKGGR